jgi:hypothetical protein
VTPDEKDLRDWKAIAVWLFACLLSALLGGMVSRVACGCGGTVAYPPEEPPIVEVSACRIPDAAPPEAAPFDATLPWFGPDPAGNEPPHRAR